MGRMGASGGLSKSKLALADAVPGDVVAPATFYAGDKELKAGTLQEMSSITDSVSFSTDSAKLYFRIPHGAYRTDGVAGYPEITSDRRGIAESLTFVPIVIIGGAAIRLSSNIDSNYVSGIYIPGMDSIPYGNASLWNSGATTHIRLTLKKAGRYAFFCSSQTQSGRSTKYFTINGTRYNAPNKQVVYLNANTTCEVYCDSTAGDWAFWGFCICYLG